MIEFLNIQQLAGRHISHLFQRAETLLYQDGGHLIVHIQVTHEGFRQRARFLLAFLLRVGLSHDVELPPRELAGKADVLAATANGL